LLVGGEAGDPEYERLFVFLTENAADPDAGVLTITQFTVEGVVIWDVRRDEAGTPRVRYWPAVPWSDLADGDVLSEHQVIRVVWQEDGSRHALVCGAPHDRFAREAFQLLVDSHRGIPAFRCKSPLDELLRRVAAAAPLTQWYELVTLQRTPSGRLILTGTQLFPPDSRRGERQPFTIHCPPSGENGTVFAVVATESVEKIRLVSLDSVSLPPGTYHLTAVLRRPGLVHFEGLPSKLREEHRAWPRIIESVPQRLDISQPAHLICAVEVSGLPPVVAERIEVAEQLINLAANAAEDRLKFSLISYGPHKVGRAFPEVPTELLAWAEDRKMVLPKLDLMRDRGAAPVGYSRAAQLECVLATVADELGKDDENHGRPVMVTIGARPAFPERIDIGTEIIPCRYRNDWRRSLQRLQDGRPGIAFGAITDGGRELDPWPFLSSGAFASMNSPTLNMQSFAEDLGLLSKVEYIPFPLIEEGS
jgi:hypothetical protein